MPFITSGRFIEIVTKCCDHQFGWIDTRLPNFCPECGEILLTRPGVPKKYEIVLECKSVLIEEIQEDYE